MERLCEKLGPLCLTCIRENSALPVTLGTALLADTEYYVFVRDKFGETYVAEITTDEDGNIVITENDFPGLFSQYAGVFTIWVSANISGTPRVEIINPDDEDNDYFCVTYTNICD